MAVKQFLQGGFAALFFITVTQASAQVTLDFESDDFGVPLLNGQSISTLPDQLTGETVFEFGNFVNISTARLGTRGHLGAAIFDSTPGVNALDPDLWVNKGNILVLQNNDTPARTLDATHGWVFDAVNDEKDFIDHGSIIFDFNSPSEMISIDLVDINGGAHVTLTLLDESGDRRIYNVPSKWTKDISVAGPIGWQTLYLNTLSPQAAEPGAIGGDATVVLDEAGFDATAVVRLDVAFDGNPSASAGLDGLRFQPIAPIPEPATAALGLLSLGAWGLSAVRRSRRV